MPIEEPRMFSTPLHTRGEHPVLTQFLSHILALYLTIVSFGYNKGFLLFFLAKSVSVFYEVRVQSIDVQAIARVLRAEQ